MSIGPVYDPFHWTVHRRCDFSAAIQLDGKVRRRLNCVSRGGRNLLLEEKTINAKV